MNDTVKLARAMQDAFERKERTTGREYVLLGDDGRDWMVEVCRQAHGDMFPDDARYFMIEAAVGALAELDDDADDDAEAEACDSIASAFDGSYADLAIWLESYAGIRFDYCDAAAEDNPQYETWKRLAAGMDYEQQEVFDLVRAALRDAVAAGV